MEGARQGSGLATAFERIDDRVHAVRGAPERKTGDIPVGHQFGWAVGAALWAGSIPVVVSKPDLRHRVECARDALGLVCAHR